MLASDLFDVSREIVMVTGGGTGIGKAIAKVLVENGASVGVVGRHCDSLARTCRELSGLRGRILMHEADLRRDEDIAAAFDAIEGEWGPVGVVVNNAAVAHRDRATQLSRETMRDLISVNVEGAFFVAQEGANRMIKAGIGGSIINVSSVLSHVPMRQVVAYGASKAALSQMTKTLALEWAKHGIRVNEIRPGWFETGLTEPFLKGPGAAIMAQQNPMKRLGAFGEYSDIDGAALLLASKASRYMTGSALTVDGGHSLGR